MPSAGPDLNTAIETTPYLNELIQNFALRALSAEKLGTTSKVDVLTVSYSGNDYVGHRYGPDSEEVHDCRPPRRCTDRRSHPAPPKPKPALGTFS